MVNILLYLKNHIDTFKVTLDPADKKLYADCTTMAMESMDRSELLQQKHKKPAPVSDDPEPTLPAAPGEAPADHSASAAADDPTDGDDDAWDFQLPSVPDSGPSGLGTAGAKVSSGADGAVAPVAKGGLSCARVALR